jgi:hypothetical protein
MPRCRLNHDKDGLARLTPSRPLSLGSISFTKSQADLILHFRER